LELELDRIKQTANFYGSDCSRDKLIYKIKYADASA